VNNDGLNAQGVIDDIHTYGGRGFSVLDENTLARVFDSGADLETRSMIGNLSSTFNGDCTNGHDSPLMERDSRSDDEVSVCN
jgi:hypothetical protein